MASVGGVFKSIGHFFACVFKGATVVAEDANKPLIPGTTITPLSIGTSIAAKLDVKAPAVISGGMAALGEIAAAYTAANPAVRNKGLSLSLDQQALEAILPAIQGVVRFMENPTGADQDAATAASAAA